MYPPWFEILLIIVSIESHAFCHWLFVRWSWFSSRVVKLLICMEFFSKRN
jgi:hypothetical protein